MFICLGMMSDFFFSVGSFKKDRCVLLGILELLWRRQILRQEVDF